MFKVIAYFFYNGKSPLNHHLGNICLYFCPSTLGKSKWCFWMWGLQKKNGFRPKFGTPKFLEVFFLGGRNHQRYLDCYLLITFFCSLDSWGKFSSWTLAGEISPSLVREFGCFSSKKARTIATSHGSRFPPNGGGLVREIPGYFREI